MSTNKTLALVLLAVVLASCGKSPSSAPVESVESLAGNPDQLQDLRQQCKVDRVKLGGALCNNVAEAANKLFFGDGKVPDTRPKSRPSSDLSAICNDSAISCLTRRSAPFYAAFPRHSPHHETMRFGASTFR